MVQIDVDPATKRDFKEVKDDLQKHEEQCSERWNNLNKDLKENFGKIDKRLDEGANRFEKIEKEGITRFAKIEQKMSEDNSQLKADLLERINQNATVLKVWSGIISALMGVLTIIIGLSRLGVL